MIIQETSGGELAPKKVQNAVCVAVIDVGESYGIEPNTVAKDGAIGMRLIPPHEDYPDQNGMAAVRFIFESEILKDDNQPFRLTFQANCTMSDKGNLKPFLNGWGVDLVRTKAGLDVVASCVGKTAMINVVHKVKGESTYANVSTAMPSDSELKPSGGFDKADYMNYCLTQYQEKEEKKRREQLNKQA
tara:strand:+ start:494 stop:1057 length:564 start_codon:yes stop_codon:yes gene_type:complete